MPDLSGQTDEYLAEQAGKGDKAAFAALVGRHSRKFYAAAFRLVLRQEDAEDVVQDAFIKLWDGRAAWQEGKSAKFTTWFYRIVVNQSLDHIAKRKDGRKRELSDDMVSGEEAADNVLWAKQQDYAVAGALAELPERQRTAITLFYKEELSQKETADIMGLTPKAVESLIGRAKQTLKERIKAYA